MNGKSKSNVICSVFIPIPKRNNFDEAHVLEVEILPHQRRYYAWLQGHRSECQKTRRDDRYTAPSSAFYTQHYMTHTVTSIKP
jgi:hypothetical protein